ncbi:MAG: hypothetical protein G01um101418_956 [Parcubacteria group bacterium Gr01-1014_18]|nr:MAG: hypothetical protein Greene041636_958 [Parcubacteria group bacterium Greene0416_36]TSC79695.1 MAG: hypothetical protein G01um101418_956 [Parcubacteria group bacterium Gr01-1014_18]TSC97857.1 MAG: hypothetical protein Greene101420_962 [Parcubacteria group bacterium Greene1014_20]TSD06481.1 MAG: hypothetical protein Greene07142_862 [Parcubacteria group bacterium Greene0714_2]
MLNCKEKTWSYNSLLGGFVKDCGPRELTGKVRASGGVVY